MENTKQKPILLMIVGAVLLFTIPLTYAMVKNYALSSKTIGLATWNVSLN